MTCSTLIWRLYLSWHQQQVYLKLVKFYWKLYKIQLAYSVKNDSIALSVWFERSWEIQCQFPLQLELNACNYLVNMSKSRAQNKVLNEPVLSEPVPALEDFQPINGRVQKEKNHIVEEEKISWFFLLEYNFSCECCKSRIYVWYFWMNLWRCWQIKALKGEGEMNMGMEKC